MPNKSLIAAASLIVLVDNFHFQKCAILRFP